LKCHTDVAANQKKQIHYVKVDKSHLVSGRGAAEARSLAPAFLMGPPARGPTRRCLTRRLRQALTVKSIPKADYYRLITLPFILDNRFS
jgi:hypothetical protein